jgi:Phage portal protein, SPP1 Gp6-like
LEAPYKTQNGMTQEDIKTLLSGSPEEVIAKLKQKSVQVPAWSDLVKQYDPKQHPVMDKTKYPDITHDDGTVEYVTRITEDLQRLAAKKATQLCVGTSVKRVYKSIDDRQKEVAKVIEKIMLCNRIDSVNIERCNMLFASCEAFTLWYAIEQEHNLYGTPAPSKLKIRCKNYSPLNGDALYPTMDSYGDMLAMSFGSKQKNGDKEVEYFDVYTSDTHIRYVNDGGWAEEVRENITILKIPGVYGFRPTPIWEDTSNICYEIEWALSRNGNYLRRNSKPIFAVFGDDDVSFGDSDDTASVDVVQYGKDMRAGYITWQQAVENLKFYVQQLRQSFFSQLQLPDTSFDSMKTTPMSGEARQMMFVDAQLKVKDESGRLVEMFDREINVIKAFVKIIMPGYDDAIDSLVVENVITPFTIRSEKEDIANIMTATGGKPIASQRQGVQYLGWSEDVEATMQELTDEATTSVAEPTM